MLMTQESPRVRWLVLIPLWIAIVGVLYSHARLVERYLGIAGALGLRGAPAATTPLVQPFPSFAADAQTWVRHALSLAEGEQGRLRWTKIDNGVHGREVHWNSGWGWTIATAGILQQKVTGEPLPRAMEKATLWLPSVVFLVVIGLFSALAAHWAGTPVGVLVALAMVGHPRIFEGFFPTYVDHHGLLTVSVFGLVLGMVMMGGGFLAGRPNAAALLPSSPETARAGAWVSALSGVFGVWISAASTLPPVAITGVAALVTLVVRRRTAVAAGERFDPGLWRLWGRIGGIGTVVAYLVEYFPNHLGLRLESNHALYGLAWWGGASAVATLGEWLTASGAAKPFPWPALARPLGAVLLVPVILLVGRERVFVVMDPFLANLHKSIQEFLPIWTTVKGVPLEAIFRVFGTENLPLIVAAILLAMKRERAPTLVWFATVAAVLFTAMGWIQTRWLLNASGPQVVLLIVLLAGFVGSRSLRTRWIAILTVAGAAFLPWTIARHLEAQSDVEARRVAPKDAHQVLSRDIAANLLASSPGAEIVLLTNPNSSTGIGYYGRIRTLGTLYWENTAGLKAAAEILSAGSYDEAAKLIQKHQVTHIAMISEENFIEQYFRLSRPTASMDEFKQSFGYKLLVDRVVPPWLQMLPYKVPDDMVALNPIVLLFKVAFNQSPADALYHLAISKVASGAVAEGERDLDTLIAQSPGSFQPWLRKGEILFSRREWAAAAEATVQGIRLAPAGDRLGMYSAAAGSFYRERQAGLAVALYKEGLKERFDPMVAAYLAFALATVNDDTVRNGREAKEIALRALKDLPENPTILNSLAVAQAETGDLPGAIVSVSSALEFAKRQGDTAVARVSEQRLAIFQAGKVVRQ